MQRRSVRSDDLYNQRGGNRTHILNPHFTNIQGKIDFFYDVYNDGKLTADVGRCFHEQAGNERSEKCNGQHTGYAGYQHQLFLQLRALAPERWSERDNNLFNTSYTYLRVTFYV